MTVEERLDALEARNRRVDANKAWETSWTRRIVIAALTYAVIVAYHLSIDAPRPWLSSVVPVVGFVLSTLAVGVVRGLWEKRIAAAGYDSNAA